jgi:hypothetical protein
MKNLCSLLENLSIDSLLDIRDKIRLYDGAYRRGNDIIIVSDTIRTVRGLLKYTYLDGNPPIFEDFSLEDIHEDDTGKCYFMLDGNIPQTLTPHEAYYVQQLFIKENIEPEFIPSLYFSHQNDEFFMLNVDGTEKYIYSIPFKIQYIDSYDDLNYVIHYIPEDRDEWCEPITERQSIVLRRILNMDVSELCPYKIES